MPRTKTSGIVKTTKLTEKKWKENDYLRLRSVEAALPAGAFEPEILQGLYSYYKEFMFSSSYGGGKSSRMSDRERVKAVNDSRRHFSSDPLIWRAFCCYWSFVFGYGLNAPKINSNYLKKFQSDEILDSNGTPIKSDEIIRIESIINGLWTDPITQQYISTLNAQQRAYMRLKQDGELPVVICANPTKTKFALMLLDSLELTDYELDPKHPGIALAWQREFKPTFHVATDAKKNGRSIGKEWYPDVMSAEYDGRPEGMPDIRDAGTKVNSMLEENKWLYLINEGADPTSPRGVPSWYSALVFSRGVNDIIKDWRSYLKSLSNWAWIQSAPGGQGRINSLAAETATTLDLKHPSGPIGKIRNTPSDVKLSPIDIGTGGANAYAAACKELKLMVSAGTGLPSHFFGDISSGKLTTAESVDIAVVKMFESEQRFIESSFDQIFKSVIRLAGYDCDTEKIIELDFPELDVRDAAPLLDAISNMGSVFPGISVELVKTAANILGGSPEEWSKKMITSAKDGNPNVLNDIDDAIDRAAESGNTDDLAKISVEILGLVSKVSEKIKESEVKKS